MSNQFNYESLDELDSQYDIGAAIPDMLDIAHKMAIKSEQVRATHPACKELFYGDLPGQALDYFFYEPGAPLLVYIHGGYWHAFDKSLFSEVGAVWNQAGVSTAVINYRLCPDVGIGEIVDDVRRSISWLWKNSKSLEFDDSNIVICGSSAGGHLTAMMLATDWTEFDEYLPGNLLKGGVAISGLYDLAPFLRAPFLKDIIRLTKEENEKYSPANLTPVTKAPLITCVGGDESAAFHAQNELIAECWPGVFSSNVVSIGTNHVTVNDELTKPGSDLFQAVQALFVS